MTAWDILKANSSAPLGSTAWVYFNSLEGGGNGYIYLAGGIDLDIQLQEFSLAVGVQEQTIELVTDNYYIDIEVLSLDIDMVAGEQETLL